MPDLISIVHIMKLDAKTREMPLYDSISSVKKSNQKKHERNFFKKTFLMSAVYLLSITLKIKKSE